MNIDKFGKAVQYYTKALKSKGSIEWVPNPFVQINSFDVPKSDILFQRAKAYYSIDSFKLAFMDFNAVLDNGNYISDCYYWIGYIYLQYGQIIFACESFRKSKTMGNSEAAIELEKYCSRQ